MTTEYTGNIAEMMGVTLHRAKWNGGWQCCT